MNKYNKYRGSKLIALGLSILLAHEIHADPTNFPSINNSLNTGYNRSTASCSSIEIENNAWKGGIAGDIVTQIGNQEDWNTHTTHTSETDYFPISAYPISIQSQSSFNPPGICIVANQGETCASSFGEFANTYTAQQLSDHGCECDAHGNADEIHCYGY